MNGIIEVKPIDVSSVQQAQTQATLMLDNAIQTVIQNQGTYEQAGFFLKTVKEKYKQLDTKRKNITTPLDTAKKAVMDLFRRPLECLEQAEQLIKRSMIKYEDDQERIRQDQERRLQAEAEKKRLDALKKADEARANGNDLKADKYESKAAAVVAPVLAARVNGVQGIARKKVWKFKVVDEKLIPREFLCVDETKLGNFARSMKGTMPVAGVEFYEEDTLAARV
jgi:hypothetical protein